MSLFHVFQVLEQIRHGPPRRHTVAERQELHEYQEEILPLTIGCAWSIPAVMWPDIVQVWQESVFLIFIALTWKRFRLVDSARF